MWLLSFFSLQASRPESHAFGLFHQLGLERVWENFRWLSSHAFDRKFLISASPKSGSPCSENDACIGHPCLLNVVAIAPHWQGLNSRILTIPYALCY